MAAVTPETLAVQPPGGAVRLDLSALVTLDTVGALVLDRLRQKLSDVGCRVEVVGPTTAHAALLEAVWRGVAEAGRGAPVRPRRPVVELVAGVGRRWLAAVNAALEMVVFFGLICGE